MEHEVQPAARGWERTFALPPSKSVHQRALVLDALATEPIPLRFAADARPSGEDVRHCAAAVARLGRWTDGGLGADRGALALDAGESGTALRFLLALACLRPPGARTLIRGRPVLLRRPHAPLRRALRRLGAGVKRRRSGAFRVVARPLARGARLTLDLRRSSQYASALALIAPRIGGLTLDLRGAAVSRRYLDLTLAMLRDVGVPVTASPARVTIGAGDPRAAVLEVPADASAAACWWTAATLAAGRARVRGIRREGRQADLALLPILETLGARIEAEDDGLVVIGPGTPTPGDRTVDLGASPDLVFLVGVLAARVRGTTRITGVAHARAKESDRLAVLVAALGSLGVEAAIEADDTVTIHGGAPRAGVVDVAGDHRAAFAFGVLGLAVPGIVLRGAEAAAKSQPGFLADLAAVGG